MPVQLTEYALKRNADGTYSYKFKTAWLFSEIGMARAHITDRIAEKGYGKSLNSITGQRLPGLAWSVQEVQGIDTLIKAGTEEDFEEEGLLPPGIPEGVEEDEPLPPDDN